MNQPELGLKVAEIRQQKGLTQEKLTHPFSYTKHIHRFSLPHPSFVLYPSYMLTSRHKPVNISVSPFPVGRRNRCYTE